MKRGMSSCHSSDLTILDINHWQLGGALAALEMGYIVDFEASKSPKPSV